MKNSKQLALFILFAATLFSTSVSAQFLNRVKGDFLVAGAGLDNGFGFGASGEIKYFFTNSIAAGIKYEYLFTLGADSDEGTASIGGRESYLATGDYFLGKKKVRPFAGLTAGLHSVGILETNSTNILEVKEGKVFGFGPRLGLQLKRTRLAFEYNVIPDNTSKGIENQSFWTIKLGYTIGALDVD